MWPVRDSLVEDLAYRCEMQQHESNDCQKDDEKQQNP